MSINIERLPEGSYRAPTQEEVTAFDQATANRKAEEKASKPTTPSLINPTDADAERLQAIWNERVKASHERHKGYGDPHVSAVVRMTQAQYSERSKGGYGICETANISELITERRGYHSEMSRTTVFKIRVCSSGCGMSGAHRVVILTDKPQKAIPWSQIEEARAEQPTEESLFPLLPEIARVASLSWMPDKENEQDRQLIQDARYVGWAFVDSMTQFGLTAAGIEAWKNYQAQTEAKAEEETPEEIEEEYAAPAGELFA